MQRKNITSLIFMLVSLLAGPCPGQEVSYHLEEYTAQEGLTAQVDNDILRVIWEGSDEQVFRMDFRVADNVPVIQAVAYLTENNDWQEMARNIIPEYRVVTGLRRVTQQQTEPLEELGIPLTPEKLDEIKWNAFWDAPLYVSDEPPKSHASSIPAREPFANHPGMPRNPEEILRSVARFDVKTCRVRTYGTRLEIQFDGLEAGLFSGFLQFDFFKGSSLLRQMMVATTEEPSVAFKYDAGWTGMTLEKSKLVWRDLANQGQEYLFGAPPHDNPVVVKTNNRLLSAGLPHGSVAVFPPPHSFFWARESEQNLGYSWYRKDNEAQFSFGIRQAEQEEDPEFYHNFALYNARPGTWQRMPVFFYLSAGDAYAAMDSALAFTHQDHYKELPGFKVMGSHYHAGLVRRLRKKGGLDQRINDVATMKALGVNIYGVIDGARGPGRHDKGELFLKDLADYYEAARRQSDEDFLLMPNDENSTGGRPPFLGGHYDMIISRPLYWRPARSAGQALVEDHPEYGKVYNIGSPSDLMKMTELENVLISMPHPDAKRSTGFPEAIMDSSYFLHENYFGLGYRWGMGIDASEKRLGELRFLQLWDEVNNQMTRKGRPLKYALAISESRSDIGERGKPPVDDTYAMSPVNYLRLDAVPSPDDMSPIVNRLKSGDYFITTGEVLVPFHTLEGEGNERKLIVELTWTFPLDFVEVVWGNGENVGRMIISTPELPAFGKKRFEIPIDVSDKSWIRFAAWDVAMNGALLQPVVLK